MKPYGEEAILSPLLEEAELVEQVLLVWRPGGACSSGTATDGDVLEGAKTFEFIKHVVACSPLNF